MVSRSSCVRIMAALAIALLYLLALRLGGPFPPGWDIFYHARVTELTLSHGFFPQDPVSAGGRQHTYPPLYHSLAAAVSLMAGVEPLQALILISALFVLLIPIAVFCAARRFGDVEAGLATLLFCTAAAAHTSLFTFGMPEAMGLFFLALVLLPNNPYVLLFCLALGGTHLLSTAAALSYVTISFFFGQTKDAAKKAALLLTPLIAMRLAFPLYNMPTWITPQALAEKIGSLGLIQLVSYLLTAQPSAVCIQSLLFLALSFFSPILPTRLAVFALLFLSLSVAGGLSRLAVRQETKILAAALVAIPLLFGMIREESYMPPLMTTSDFEALKWVGQNTRTDSRVLGYKDMSAMFVMYYGERDALLDGYSEAVRGAYEKMKDEFEAYAAGDNSYLVALSRKYGVKYLYTTSLEEKWFSDFDYEKFRDLPSLFENGYASIRTIS